MDAKYLANKYNTPLCVYDFDCFSEKYTQIKAAFKARKSLVVYLLKENSNLSIVKHFAMQGCGAGCASLCEVKKAIRSGIKPYKIIFFARSNKEEELKKIINLDLLYVGLENGEDFLKLERIAKLLQKKVRISIKVDLGEPERSCNGKNGIDLQEAKKIYLKAKNSEFLEPVGISFSQPDDFLNTGIFKNLVKKTADLVKGLRAVEIDVKFFDVGSELGVDFIKEKSVDLYKYAQDILKSIGGQDLTIVCTPSKFLLCGGGSIISKVVFVEEAREKQTAILDSFLLTRAVEFTLDGQKKETILFPRSNKLEKDFKKAQKTLLPKLKKEDLLIFKFAGTCDFSKFDKDLRPIEIAIENKKDRIIQEKELCEELIQNEEEFLF